MSISTLAYSLSSSRTFLASRGNTVIGPPPTPDSDPYFSSVKLLLHGDGSTGSTTFVDSSLSANQVTAVGSVTVATSQKKYGSGSIYVSASSSCISSSSSADFALSTGNFTIESWVYLIDTSINLQTIFTIGSYINGLLFRVYNPSAGILDVYCNGQQYSFNKSTIAVNTWHHFALVRSAGTVTAYVNGEQFGTSQAMTQDIPQGAMYVGMSQHNGAEYTHGYLDDFRLTKGIARYTANFTPPTAAFPNQ